MESFHWLKDLFMGAVKRNAALSVEEAERKQLVACQG